jgi:hypothetical protein
VFDVPAREWYGVLRKEKSLGAVKWPKMARKMANLCGLRFPASEGMNGYGY